MTTGAAFLESRPAPRSFAPEQFDAEATALFDAARRFQDEVVWPRRDAIEAKTPGVLEALLDQAADLGLTAIDLPEAHGGLGLPLPVATRVLETVAREQSFMLTLMVHNGIGSQPVALFGSAAQRDQWLPAFAAGTRRGCYCLTEPGSGSDALAARATARLDGAHWVLDGTKQFITNAGIAHVGFVFAKVTTAVDGKSGFSCFIVPLDAPGVRLGPEEHKLGIKGSSTRQVILEGARIPAGNVLGEIGRGHVIAFNILNNGRYKLGAAALGSAKYALDAAIAYAAERRQFGRPVLDFGMLRRKVGQAAADIYAVESAIYRAGGDIEAAAQGAGGGPQAKLAALQDHAVECSIAKIAGSELLGAVADEALQMFGGYGFLEEFPAARYVRDARIARIYEGTNEVNRLVMPRTVVKKLGAGELRLDGGGHGVVAPLRACVVASVQAVIEAHGAGAGFDADQELMAHLADQMIALYLADSTALRVAAHPAPRNVHRDVLALVLAQQGRRIAHLAAEIGMHLGAAIPAPALAETDVLATRQRIAEHVVAQGHCTL